MLTAVLRMSLSRPRLLHKPENLVMRKNGVRNLWHLCLMFHNCDLAWHVGYRIRIATWDTGQPKMAYVKTLVMSTLADSVIVQ
jgi:hypothetical protein